jgi:hypothetical protein
VKDFSIGFQQMTLLQAALDYYGSLPNWAQIAIQWLIRAAVASFILAQWSSVATYWYAMRYGARPPVEGVPFLALTVAVVGLALLALTIILFYGAPIILKFIRFILAFPIDSFKIKISGLLEIVERILSSIIIFGFLAIMIFITFPRKNIGTTNQNNADIIIYIFLVVFATLFIVIVRRLLARSLNDNNIHRISFGLYAISIAVLMVLMLSTPFDHILRATKFGGGVKVDIDLRDQARLAGQGLFLTSANFVTVFDPATAKFRELNRDHIIQIEYAGVEGWHLPREKDHAEIFGFDDLGTTTTSATPTETKPHRRP